MATISRSSSFYATKKYSFHLGDIFQTLNLMPLMVRHQSLIHSSTVCWILLLATASAAAVGGGYWLSSRFPIRVVVKAFDQLSRNCFITLHLVVGGSEPLISHYSTRANHSRFGVLTIKRRGEKRDWTGLDSVVSSQRRVKQE